MEEVGSHIEFQMMLFEQQYDSLHCTTIQLMGAILTIDEAAHLTYWDNRFANNY